MEHPSIAASVVNTSSSSIEFSGDIAVFYRLTKVCHCPFPRAFTVIQCFVNLDRPCIA